MKLSFSGIVVLALGMLSASIPALAHHSFAAEYDQKQPITLKGVVTHLDWMNPHVYFTWT